MSFSAVDSSSNATKPMNDGDIIEFDFGNSVVRYVAGGSNANALPVTYTDGSHTFSTNEEMDVYIYPQNKAGASKEYVDDQDALKLNLTGGNLTGNLRSTHSYYTDKTFVANTAGTNFYSFLLQDSATSDVRLGISHPSSNPDEIRYKALTGSKHAFYNYDSDGTNGKEVLSIGRTNIKVDTDLSIHASSQVRYKNTVGEPFFNLFEQSTDECRLNVRPGKSFKITGTFSGTVTNLFQVNTSGNVLIHRVVTPTADTMAANKAYVDSKVASGTTTNATGAIKGIAKLGQLPQGTSVPNLDKGQLFYNTTNKTLLLKA
jgi:hypothetical protein